MLPPAQRRLVGRGIVGRSYVVDPPWRSSKNKQTNNIERLWWFQQNIDSQTVLLFLLSRMISLDFVNPYTGPYTFIYHIINTPKNTFWTYLEAVTWGSFQSHPNLSLTQKVSLLGSIGPSGGGTKIPYKWPSLHSHLLGSFQVPARGQCKNLKFIESFIWCASFSLIGLDLMPLWALKFSKVTSDPNAVSTKNTPSGRSWQL